MDKKILFISRVMAVLVGLFLTLSYFKLGRCLEPTNNETDAYSEYFDKGLEYFENGQWQEAAEQFQKVILSSPENAMAYRFLGVTNFLLDKEKDGREYLNKAIKLYEKAGDYPEAEEVLSVLNNYLLSNQETIDREAIASLQLIQQAERLLKLINNSYIDCDSTTDCNTKLNLELSPAHWNFRVFTEGDDSFCSEAIGNNGVSNWFIKKDGGPASGRCK